MVYKLKRFVLDAMFEFYGTLHHCRINKARKCLENGKTKAADYWIRKSEQCIYKREDILERLIT